MQEENWKNRYIFVNPAYSTKISKQKKKKAAPTRGRPEKNARQRVFQIVATAAVKTRDMRVGFDALRRSAVYPLKADAGLTHSQGL